MFVKKGFSALCILVLIVIFFVMIKKLIIRFDIFLNGVEYYLTIAFGAFIVLFYLKKYRLSVCFYMVMLFIFLTFREKVEKSYSFDLYLGKWLKVIFTNQTVFINIIGNLILFTPITIVMLLGNNNYVKTFLYVFLLIVFLEVVQFVTKTGVFDIIDIFLNTIGILLGFLFYSISFQFKKISKN